MTKGIIWNKTANLDHLVISLQCIPQAVSWEEKRGTVQDMIGNMLSLEILSGRREGRQFLSQPIHSATIPAVQRALCKISLLLLTKKNRENQNPSSVTEQK